MKYQGKSASARCEIFMLYVFSCDDVFKKSSLGFLFYLPPLSNISIDRHTDRQTDTHTYNYTCIFIGVCNYVGSYVFV